MSYTTMDLVISGEIKGRKFELQQYLDQVYVPTYVTLGSKIRKQCNLGKTNYLPQELKSSLLI